MVFIHSSERGHNRDCTYCPTSAPPDILHQSRDLYFLRKVRRIVYYVKARVLENPGCGNQGGLSVTVLLGLHCG